MGSFWGHIIPGTFFVVFAVWWATQITKRNHLCRLKGIPFYSTLTFPYFHPKLLHIPVEGIAKILAAGIALSGELIVAYDFGKSSTPIILGNIQHATMYSFFCFSGLCDILQAKWKALPPGVDYIAQICAFGVEGVLLRFHLHGRTDVDIEVHMLFIWTVLATIIVLIIEYNNPHSELICLLRIFFVLLQGTWFIQVAFILYNPLPGYKEWEKGETNVSAADVYCIWHALLNIIAIGLIMLISNVVRKRFFPISRESVEYEMFGIDSYRYTNHKSKAIPGDIIEDGSAEEFDSDSETKLQSVASNTGQAKTAV